MKDQGSLRASPSVLLGSAGNLTDGSVQPSNEAAELAIKRDKARFAIGFYLLSGWLPWAPHGAPFGQQPPSLSLCGAESGRRAARWILCCGHTLSPAEGERWIAAGLARKGAPDRFGRPTLARGPELDVWVSDCWNGLRAKTWGQP